MTAGSWARVDSSYGPNCSESSCPVTGSWDWAVCSPCTDLSPAACSCLAEEDVLGMIDWGLPSGSPGRSRCCSVGGEVRGCSCRSCCWRR